jgi:hypothetical protein
MVYKTYLNPSNLPLRNGILLVPQIRVPQLVVRVVLEPYGSGRRPLGMLFGDALLGDALHAQLLTLPQLADDGSQALGVSDNWVAHPLVGAHVVNDQVACVDLHDLVAGAARVQGQRHAAQFAVLVALAVARVHHVVDILRDQRDQAQAVADELVRQHRRVGLDLDQVDGHRGHFCEDGPADGVGEGEVDVLQLEIYILCTGLEGEREA